MTKHLLFACMMLTSKVMFAQKDTSVRSLEEVIVTANRFPQKQISTGKVITTITRAQIEKTPVQSVGELLSTQSGINVLGTNNAPGTNPDLYFRGAGTGSVLILVDGNPAYDASTIRSTFDLNFIPLDEIERIEILKGGQSTLYGSDAVAGVINIITRSNEQKKLKANLHLSAGSYKTKKSELSVGGKTKLITYKAELGTTRSAGFSSAADTFKVKSFDKDGMHRRFVRAEIGSLPGKSWNWTTSFQQTKYSNDMDETRFEDAKDSKVDNSNMQWNAQVSRKLGNATIHANFSTNNSVRHYKDDSLYLNGFSKFILSDFTGRSSYAELYSTIKLSDQIQLFTGIDHRWQNTDQYYFSVSSWGDYSSTISSDSAKTNVSSATASLVYNGKKGFNVEGGVRYNKHSRYGDHVTYTFNPSYLFKNKFKFAYNLSSAFMSPTLYQLYDGYSGEHNLQPETSVSNEVSVQYIGMKDLNLRATFFSRNIDHGIDYSYESYKYYNYGKKKDHGMELEASYTFGKWDMHANYTYLKGNVTTANYVYNSSTWLYEKKGDTTYSHLFRVPASTFNAHIGIQASKKLYISISQKIAGKRFEPIYGASPVEMKAFQTTDLFLQYSVNRSLKIYGSLRNLFNTQYQEIWGYNTMGRNVVLGVRF